MELEDLIATCNSIAHSYGYTIDVPIQINPRLSSTLARVRYKKTLGSTRKNPDYEPCAIEFSKRLMDENDELIQSTIRHELAHYFVLIDTHQAHQHDRVWKRWASRLGISTRATTSSSSLSSATQPQFNYQVICTQCGKTIGRYIRAGKVVKNASRYHSLCCGAPIRIKKISHTNAHHPGV